jgi:hypothetical protein
MSIAVVTYPRSGSTYLSWLLGYSFGMQIDKFHLDKDGQLDSLINYDCTITAFRDPAESISSIVTLESVYFRNDQDFDTYVNKIIKLRIDEYVRFYTLAKDNINLHFDYNIINTKRKELVDYVSEFTGKKIINTGYIDLVKDRPSNNYLRTSKNVEDYEKVLKYVLNHDLSKCLEVYDSCKEISINL